MEASRGVEVDDFVLIKRSDLEDLIDKVIGRQLEPLRQVLLCPPDETIISDHEAARRLGRSVATLRRMKRDGRISTVPTANGLAVRVCDLDDAI